MKHEKIIVKNNGDKCIIKVDLNLNWSRDTFEYKFNIGILPKGKRKATYVKIDDYEYRQQPFPHGRDRYEIKKYLEHVSLEDLYEAKLELWEKIKPSIDPYYGIPIQ